MCEQPPLICGSRGGAARVSSLSPRAVAESAWCCKRDPMRIFIAVSLLATDRHAYTALSQVVGGKWGRRARERSGGSGEQGLRGPGTRGAGAQGYAGPTPHKNQPLRFSGTCWQLSEGCHSFLCRVTRTGWNWFEADQLLNTMQSLSYYTGIASSLHGSQKQRSLQKDTIPKQYVNAHFRHTALVCG